MTVHSLFPAFVRLNYTSVFGPHVAIIPTLAYNPSTDEFDTWTAGVLDATIMIEALVDKLLPFYPTTTNYASFEIFTLASELAEPLLKRVKSMTSKDGTSFFTGWSKATQGTLSMLDTDGFKVRLQLMDSESNDDWDATTSLPGSGPLFDLVTEFSDDDKGWASRAGNRPALFLEYSKTLNEKLRRAYRMF